MFLALSEIISPSSVTEAGSVTFWSHLTDLKTETHRRVTYTPSQQNVELEVILLTHQLVFSLLQYAVFLFLKALRHRPVLLDMKGPAGELEHPHMG